MYLAHTLLHAARDEPRETEDERAAAPAGDGGHGPQALSREALEPVPVTAHASAPALTPLLFALAGGLIASGLVFTRWLVIAGALVLASVAIAWLLETAPRRAGHGAEQDDHANQHEEAPAGH